MTDTIRSCFIGAILFLSWSTGYGAQEEQLPAPDSFSYLKDPLFGIQREAPVPVKQACPEPDQAIIVPPPVKCPEPGVKVSLSSSERYELQLALDKALSQILKLTVDYEALRTRVENMAQRELTNDNDWFPFRDSKITEKDQAQELAELNRKQLADRQEKIELLAQRLDTLQSRFDKENVARLLAEKRLAKSRDEQEKLRQQAAAADDQLIRLTGQLEASQAHMRKIQAELSMEQAKSTRSLDAVGGNETHAAGSVQFEVAKEWIIEGLRFEKGSARIDSTSLGSLDRLLSYLKQNPGIAVQVNGYTDNVGSESSNQRLSQQRADAVADYLIEQGINPFRIAALGYGERRPVAGNGTEQGRLQNRRVAVLLLDQSEILAR